MSYEKVHDVIIVGAGPCGLAVAARLKEDTPSAIFTDEEHNRYHWIQKHANKTSRKSAKNAKVKSANQPCNHPSILVLDESGTDWMSHWNKLFNVLKIEHLRSPMFFHLDPRDRDGLLAFAYEHGRQNDTVEIPGCVGREISKHKRKQRTAKRPKG